MQKIHNLIFLTLSFIASNLYGIEPSKTDVLVAITAHYNSARLKYLSQVVAALSKFPKIKVIIVTNTEDDEKHEMLRNACSTTPIDIRTYPHLADPLALTWCHKEIIKDEFLQSEHTHFIYLEDDMELSWQNFCYFLEYREILRPYGLLPSFLRVEFRDETQEFVNTDNWSPTSVSEQHHMLLDDQLITTVDNPYMAGFILDQELAEEYVQSHSFSQYDSRHVSTWGIQERAAMGLCFENIPKPWKVRYVVPIDAKTGIAPVCTWVYHLPNNYSNMHGTRFGRLPMDKVFILP